MIKQLVTVTSFALGGAGVALVGYLGADPRAFTHPVTELAPAIASHPPQLAPVRFEDENRTIVIGEVLITPSVRKVAPQKVSYVRFRPCSEWKNVGASFIEPAGATGVHFVRRLCANPTTTSDPIGDE